jgi:hypothetical protein
MAEDKTGSQQNTTFHFAGFCYPQYTQVPNQLFDELLARLTGNEIKVLLYICRHTYGFHKESDNISLNQMLQGIRRGKDGNLQDMGVGLSKPTLLRSLKSLSEKNIIIVERRKSREKGNEPTNYRLNIRTTLGKEMNPGGSQKLTKPLGSKIDQEQKKADIQKTPRQQDAAAVLADYGIDKATINRLVNSYEANFILEKSDYVNYLKQAKPDKIANPRGWLLKAIEDDYEPPAGYSTQAERDRESAERALQAEKTKKQREQLQKVLGEAAEKQKEEEEKALNALRERYGTTEEDIELWQSILDELKEGVGGLTYAFAKAVNLLTIEDDVAFFAAKNKFSVDRINENSIGDLLVEIFRKRGFDLKDMKPVIIQESGL